MLKLNKIIEVDFARNRKMTEQEKLAANGSTTVSTSLPVITPSMSLSERKSAQAKINASKRRKEPIQPLKDPENIQKVINYLKTTGKYALRNWLLFVIGISTGLRCSDIVVLTFGHFFNDSGTIKDVIEFREKKTGKVKLYNVSAQLKEALMAYTSSLKEPFQLEQHIFYSNKKSSPHLKVDTVREILVEAVEKAINDEIREQNEMMAVNNDPYNQNVEVNTKRQIIHAGSHTMRKTYALHALKAAEDEKKKNSYAPSPLTVVQALLNHSSELMTLRYLGIDLETRSMVERHIHQNLVF